MNENVIPVVPPSTENFVHCMVQQYVCEPVGFLRAGAGLMIWSYCQNHSQLIGKDIAGFVLVVQLRLQTN